MKERSTKFETPTSLWEVTIDDGVEIDHNGYFKSAYKMEDLEEAANEMAYMVHDSIMAMPENHARKLIMVCGWYPPAKIKEVKNGK